VTTERSGSSGAADPTRAGRQMWEAGYQSLFEGWRQAQEFWNSAARSWGELGGAWMNQVQTNRGERSGEMLRELQEAAFSVAQAWLRLPLVLAGGAQPGELQEALTRLAETQGRAYQMWLESLTRMAGRSGAAEPGAGEPGESRRNIAIENVGNDRGSRPCFRYSHCLHLLVTSAVLQRFDETESRL